MTPAEYKRAADSLDRRVKDQLHKRAERQRRREAGEVRCEIWVTPNDVSEIKRKHGNEMWTPSDCVRFAVAWCVRQK